MANGGIIGPQKCITADTTKVTSFTASGTFQKHNCTVTTAPEILVIAGGGGGAGSSSGGSAGAGGGGTGSPGGSCTHGGDNTGGGGGGNWYSGCRGIGGSGIVVVRAPSATVFTGSPCCAFTASTHPGGDKIAKFTASGTLTVR